LQACSIFHQPGDTPSPIISRIIKTDYNTAWLAVLEALKDVERVVTNREAGVVQTAWIDNTERKVSSEFITGGVTFMKAKYRLTVTVAPGTYKGKAAVKVSVQKEQFIQKDIMEGWTQIKSDQIEENTLLYRIGRIVLIKEKLKRLEEEKIKKAFQEGAT
jgi:hypothetical protein